LKILFKAKLVAFLFLNVAVLLDSYSQITFTNIQDDLCENNGIIQVVNQSLTLPYELNIIYPNLSNTSQNVFTDTLTLENLAGGEYIFEAISGGTTVNGNVEILSEIITTNFFVNTFFNNGYGVECHGDCDGQIFSSVSPTFGGTPTGEIYTTLWYEDSVVVGQDFFSSNTSNNTNQGGLCAGQYAFLYVSPSGCERVRYYELVEPDTIQTSAESTSVLCSGGFTGEIDLSVEGGVGPTFNEGTGTFPDTLAYTYSWNGPNSFAANTQDISGLEGGMYTVTVTDNNNCIFVENYEVIDSLPELVVSVLSFDSISCNGGSNGSIQIGASGGSGDLIYSIDGINYQTSNTFTNLTSGTYPLSARDTNNCVSTLSFDLPQYPDLFISNVTVQNILCADSLGSASISVSGGSGVYSYSINNVTQSDSVFPNFTPGDYNLVTFDSNNCFADTLITVTEVSTLDLSLGIINPVCFADSNAQITVVINGGTAPFTYTLNDTIVQNTQTFSNLVAGDYTILVEDDNNCPIDTAITITQPNAITVSLDDMDSTSCFGVNDGRIFTTSSGGQQGGYNYFWLFDGAPFLVNDDDIDGLLAGVYSLEVSDLSTCTSDQYDFEVFQPNPLVVNVDDLQTLSCFDSGDGSITVSGSGGTGSYNYTWTGIVGNNLQTLNGLDAGDYELILRDENNCDTTVTISVAEPDVLSFPNPQLTNVECFDAFTGVLEIEVAGGTSDYTFSIFPNIGSLSTNANVFTASALSAQVYTVQVLDENDCMYEEDFPLIQNSEITASFTTSSETCNNNNATVLANISGGIPTYSFNWVGLNETSNFVDSLAGGFTYNLEVTDDLGCLVSFNEFVPNVFPVTINSINKFDLSCSGADDGRLEVNVSDGTAPYTFTLFSGGVQQYQFTSNNLVDTLTGIAPGDYTIQAQDFNSCVYNWPSVITINSPELLSVGVDSLITTTDLICNGDNNGKIFLNITGGTPYSGGYYDLFINNPFFSQQVSVDSITGLLAGTYEMTVQDFNGCLATISHTINQPDDLSVSSLVTDVLCYEESTGSALIFIEGGVADYTLTTVSPDAIISQLSTDTFEITNLSEGVYFFDIIDANGCESLNFSINVEQPNELEILNTSSTLESCLGGDATAEVSFTGGSGSNVFLWSYDSNFQQPIQLLDGQLNPTNQSANPQFLSEGLHYIHIWDFNGCYTYDSVAVNRATNPSLELLGTTNNLCHDDEQGQITVNATQGNPFYEYSINGGVTWQYSPVFENLGENSYNIMLRDSLGCSDDLENIEITEPEPISVIVEAQMVRCFGDNNGLASVTNVFGGTSDGDYSYQWQTSEGVNLWPANLSANTSEVGSLSTGSYQVVVEDDNECSTIYSPVIIGEPLEVNVDLSIISDFNGVQISCNDASDGVIMAIASGGTGDFTFTWTNGVNNLEINTAATFDTLFSQPQGSYYVSVSDENQCSNSNQISISEPDSISVSLEDVINIRCEGEAAGSANAVWSGGLGFGTYNVIWTDSDNNTLSLVSQVTNLDTGTYIVNVTDNNGCSSSTDLIIDYSELFQITNTTDTVYVSCNGSIDGSFDFQVEGGWLPYTHSWNDPLNQQQSTAYGLAPGNWYMDVVMDGNGCVVYDSVFVDEPSQVLAIFNVDVDDADCFGENSGSINLEVEGGTENYQFSWVGPSYTSANQNISNLVSGMYSLTVTDVNGCQAFGSYQVDQPSAPVQIVSVNTTNVDCNGNNTGTASIASITGGTGNTQNFNQDWGGENPNELEAGSYTVIITDQNGCTDDHDYIIYEPEALQANVEVLNENCEGQDGQIIVHATGGELFNNNLYNYGISPNYQSSPNNQADIAVDFPSPGELADTIFTMTLTDANGCEFIIEDIEVHPARIFDYNASINVCYGDTIEVVAKYNEFINYTWTINPSSQEFELFDNSITTSVKENLTITVSGEDASGCVFADQMEVNLLTPDVSVGDDLALVRGEEIVLTVSQGEEPFVWNNLETTRDIIVSPIVTTYYSVTALDTSNGCIGSDTLRVFVGMNGGFTPNSDGYNDFWQIDYLNQYEGAHIEIFNRWGSRLWQADYPNIENWNGKYNDEDLPVGTYYYIISFPDGSNKDPLTGPVTIVR
jgi:gliding motility-associated-like protein